MNKVKIIEKTLKAALIGIGVGVGALLAKCVHVEEEIESEGEPNEPDENIIDVPFQEVTDEEV